MEFSQWFLFAILLTHSKLVPNVQGKTDKYCLPENAVKVKLYDIKLFFQNDVFKTNVFTGVVKIQFVILRDTNEIKLHANGINFTTVSLTHNLKPLEIKDKSFKSDPVTDILTIRTKINLGKNSVCSLEFAYEGKLRNDENLGFYKISYTKSDGGQVFLGTTHFKPTSARKVFPCFDEPGYKARFDIQIKHPSNYTAVGNTISTSKPDEKDKSYTVTTFVQTHQMATYLVGFFLSDFTCDKGMTDEFVEHFVCSRPEAAPTRKVAVATVVKCVEFIQQWMRIKYYVARMMKKGHHFAIPSIQSKTMENWGLFSYNEANLLVDENECPNIFLQNVKSSIARSVAHVWFGGLATVNWWSDIFLHEGFAVYFQYLALSHIHSDWEMTKQFVVMELQSVLAIDSSPTSQALSWPVSSQKEIASRFDLVSYSKGASILRMIENFLEYRPFHFGVRMFVSNHKYNNFKPNALWSRFGRKATNLPSGTSFAQVINNWIVKPGYPVLKVTSKGLNVTISQNRFVSSGKASNDDKWYVPISYTTSNQTDFENTEMKAWLRPNESLVLINVLSGKNDWIILNNQQTGYYRIHYETSLWTKIKTALHSKGFGGIHELNRAQIIDDYYNFAKVGINPLSDFFGLIQFLKNDTSYYPWYSAFNAFSNMLASTGNSKVRRSLSNYLLDTMSTLYSSVPFNKPNHGNHIYSLKRGLAANWACRLRLKNCVENAVAAFKKYTKSNNRPDKNLRDVIYCNGLRYSTDPEKDWNHVWNDFKTTKLASEQALLLSALGCVKDKTVVNKYLALSISPKSNIREQDVFFSICANNDEGIDIAFDFLLKNYKKVPKYYNSLLSIVTTKFTRRDQTDKLSAFLKTATDLPKSSIRSTRDLLTKALDKLEETEQLEKKLGLYFAIKIPTRSTPPHTTKQKFLTTRIPKKYSRKQKNSGTFLETEIVTLIIIFWLRCIF